ncbi:WAP four-disulfide core domain protein 18-like [Branchiostoma floridae x Branchiostoma japonicum]
MKVLLLTAVTVCLFGAALSCWGLPPERQDPTPTEAPPPPAVGECPDTTGMVGACAEFCSSDADCRGGQRCCSNGCGHACMDVIGG